MAIFDLSSTTIEHIYPQKAQTGHVDAELELVKNRLGNLSVLSAGDNTSIGNENFQKKRKEFGKSSVALNRELAKLKSWNVRNFEIREATLCDMAVTIFDTT